MWSQQPDDFMQSAFSVTLCSVASTVLCSSFCQLIIVCPGYDLKLPPSAGANDLKVLKRPTYKPTNQSVNQGIYLENEYALFSPYLGLGQTEWRGHFESLRSREIFVDAELTLELQQLLTGERRPRSTSLSAQQMLLMLLNWWQMWRKKFNSINLIKRSAALRKPDRCMHVKCNVTRKPTNWWIKAADVLTERMF